MFGEIRNKEGEKIDYSLHAENERSDFIVIIGHGVTGNKDRPFILALANGLEMAGIPTLRISFTGNGDSEGSFADCTISKETEDYLTTHKGHPKDSIPGMSNTNG